MPPVPLPRLAVCTAALALALAARAEDRDLAPAWAVGAQGDFAAALADVPAAADGAEARFTRAMLAFNRQPQSDANLREASATLAELARDGATAELRARSLYFQARAETLRQPDGAEAGALYTRLWRDYPAETWGQRGLVHLLLIAFYGSGERADVLARVAALAAQAPALGDRVVRSEFHQVAARGYLHLGGCDAQALDELLQVAALGVARREALGDLHVSIGSLAGELGRTALAREHYAAFLREFPNDPRAYTVRARLAALPGGA